MPHKYKDQDYAKWLDIPYFHGYFSSALSGKVSESTINILANTVALTHAMKMRDHHAGLIAVPDSKRDCAARFIENVNKRLESQEESDDWLELFIAGHDEEKKIEKPIEQERDEELHYSDDEYANMAALEFIRTSSSSLNLSPQQLITQLVRLQQQQLLHRSKHRAQQRKIFAGTMLGRFMGSMTWGLGRAFAKFLGVKIDKRPRLLIIPEVVKNIARRVVKMMTIGNIIGGTAKASMSRTQTKVSGGKSSGGSDREQAGLEKPQNKRESSGRELQSAKPEVSKVEKLERREVELSSTSLSRGKDLDALHRDSPAVEIAKQRKSDSVIERSNENVKQRKSEPLIERSSSTVAKAERYPVSGLEAKELTRSAIDKKPPITSRNVEPVATEKTGAKIKEVALSRGKNGDERNVDRANLPESNKKDLSNNNVMRALKALRSVVSLAIANSPESANAASQPSKEVVNLTSVIATRIAPENPVAEKKPSKSETSVPAKPSKQVSPDSLVSETKPAKPETSVPAKPSNDQKKAENSRAVALTVHSTYFPEHAHAKKLEPKPTDRIATANPEHHYSRGEDRDVRVPGDGLEIMPLIDVAVGFVQMVSEELKDAIEHASKKHEERHVNDATSVTPSSTPGSFDLAKREGPKSHVEKLAAQGEGDGIRKSGHGRG